MGFGDTSIAFCKAFAIIRADCPCYADWVEVFVTGTVPLEGPMKHHALSLEGVELDFYMIDVTSLSDDVRDRLVALMTRTFGMAEEEVRDDLDHGEGIPILAKHVKVTIDARHVF